MATFNIKETRDNITVEVEVPAPPVGLRNKNKQSVTKSDVLKQLQRKNIVVGECIHVTVVSNFGKNPVLKDSFVFAKKHKTKQKTKEEKVLLEEEIVTPEESPVVEPTEDTVKVEIANLSREITKVSRRKRKKKAS
jgi:hypothetical protein